MTPRQELEVVLDADHADAIIQHRQAKRAKLTPYAAKLLAAQFAKCENPNAAAEEMLLRGWQGFKADWVSKVPANTSLPKPTTTPSTIAAKVLQAMQEADSLQGQGQLGFTL